MKHIFSPLALLFAIGLLTACDLQQTTKPTPAAAPAAQAQAEPNRPNVLIIMADDLGFSDIGTFGSEIATPNLDSLAASGLALSNFHVHTMCTPTRAMLLSGVNNHATGIGTMAAEQRGGQKGAPGYEAYLREEVITIADLLKGNGYRNYITGKWDLGGRKDAAFEPQHRGFDKSFILVEGSADHFRHFPALAELPDINYRYNGTPVDTLPEDFYSTTAFTDYMLEFLQQHEKEDKDTPFFAYLSYTAPHYPLQAPDEAIARYAGMYDAGYDAIASKRLASMKAKGIIADNIDAAPSHPAWPAWDSLTDTQQSFEARRMEVYAAMIDEMDRGIGRMIDYLRETDQLDNTLVIFLSDNGPEGGNPLDWADYYTEWATESFDLSLENLGRPMSFAWTGPGWAQVSSTPFSLYKGFTNDGGSRVPLIMHWPDGLKRTGIDNSFAHVLDLPATILDYAKTTHPGTKNSGFGNRALEGSSMTTFLAAEADTIHSPTDVSVWEMVDRRAVRQGDWKITWANKPWGKGLGAWSLYNLADDPTEQTDLSEQHPEKVAELLVHWEDYVERNQLVLVPEGIDILWTNIFTHYDWSPIPNAAKK